MSHTFHRCRNGLFIYNISRSKIHSHMEPLPDQPFQDFDLHVSHEHGVDFSQLLVPYNMKLRIFLFQFSQLLQHLVHIAAFRQNNLIVQYRLQYWHIGVLCHAKSLSWKSMGKACHCAHGSRGHFFHQFKSGARVNPDLVSLFLPHVLSCCHISLAGSKKLFYFQCPACNLHIGKTVSLIVSGNLIDFRTKSLRICRTSGVPVQSVDQLLHPFHSQCRAKIAWKNLSICDQTGNLSPGYFSCFQIFFQQFLVTHSKALQKFFRKFIFHQILLFFFTSR